MSKTSCELLTEQLVAAEKDTETQLKRLAETYGPKIGVIRAALTVVFTSHAAIFPIAKLPPDHEHMNADEQRDYDTAMAELTLACDLQEGSREEEAAKIIAREFAHHRSHLRAIMRAVKRTAASEKQAQAAKTCESDDEDQTSSPVIAVEQAEEEPQQPAKPAAGGIDLGFTPTLPATRHYKPAAKSPFAALKAWWNRRGATGPKEKQPAPKAKPAPKGKPKH
jgi:hypothetical protein